MCGVARTLTRQLSALSGVLWFVTTKFKTLTLALGAAALLAPAATAHKPENPGPSSAHSHGKAHGKTGKMAVLRGVVLEDPTTAVVKIDVLSANKWGRYLVDDAEVLVDTTGAKVKIADDIQPDGNHNLDDVQVGDRVHVLARVTKAEIEAGDNSLVAKRFHDKGQPEATPTP